MSVDLKSCSVVRPLFEFSFSQEFPFMPLLPWNSLGWGGNVQEWLVFSDYAPESNLIPTFVIVPFFENFVFVFVFLNYAPEGYLIVTFIIVQPAQKFAHIGKMPPTQCFALLVIPNRWLALSEILEISNEQQHSWKIFRVDIKRKVSELSLLLSMWAIAKKRERLISAYGSDSQSAHFRIKMVTGSGWRSLV